MRLRCSKCGQPVSTEVPDDTVVSAWMECPLCCSSPSNIDVTVGRLLFQFPDHADWVANARREWKKVGFHEAATVCIDSLGRILRTGREFLTAKRDDAYPVSVYAIDTTVDATFTGPDECPGYGRGGTKEPCCDRVGEYNGFGNGPMTFTCPQHCSCHD